MILNSRLHTNEIQDYFNKNNFITTTSTIHNTNNIQHHHPQRSLNTHNIQHHHPQRSLNTHNIQHHHPQCSHLGALLASLPAGDSSCQNSACTADRLLLYLHGGCSWRLYGSSSAWRKSALSERCCGEGLVVL